jgi:hypothetical protein
MVLGKEISEEEKKVTRMLSTNERSVFNYILPRFTQNLSSFLVGLIQVAYVQGPKYA